MNTTLLMSAAVACGTGLLFALLLARPLHATLRAACSRGTGAGFWTVYAGVMLVLAPAIGVLFLAAFPNPALSGAVLFARGLLFGLICVAIALLAIGRMLRNVALKHLEAELRQGQAAAVPERP